MSNQLSTNSHDPLDALRNLATNSQRKTVVSTSVAPQTVFLRVSEYLQNSQGEYAAKGVSIETGEELIISLFPAKEGVVRMKDLGNYANDAPDASMSVGTAPGGVIRFDNCFEQADGTLKSGYATMAVRNPADGVADFVRIHKSMTATGGTTFDDNGVRVVCLDKRLVEQTLRASENARENIVANILAEQTQDFIPIPVIATLLSQHRSEFSSLEQAISFLTKIGNASFALTDASLAKEYMGAGNGSYRASILDTKNAIQVTNAQEIKDALQMALKSPDNDASLAGTPGGYDAEAVIRVLASDANGKAGNSAVILNIKPTRQKTETNDFAFKPLHEDLNGIMNSTKVSTILTIMNEMPVKVEIIPMRTYLASSLGKKKLNAFSISQIVENSNTSDGEPVFAKELVSLRLFQKPGNSPFFLISTISPVSEASLNMSKSTLEMLTTKNIKLEPQVVQIANKAKTEAVPVPTHSLGDHGVSHVGADMDMNFDPNDYEHGQPKNETQPTPISMMP